MTDVKQPSEKSAVEGADSEPVKMFTHFTQSTLDNETNLSSDIWAYIFCYTSSERIFIFAEDVERERGGFTRWGRKAFHTPDKMVTINSSGSVN